MCAFFLRRESHTHIHTHTVFFFVIVVQISVFFFFFIINDAPWLCRCCLFVWRIFVDENYSSMEHWNDAGIISLKRRLQPRRIIYRRERLCVCVCDKKKTSCVSERHPNEKNKKKSSAFIGKKKNFIKREYRKYFFFRFSLSLCPSLPKFLSNIFLRIKISCFFQPHDP